MTPEERALELYPVEYQDKVGRKHPDRNLPFRRAFLEGFKIGYREGYEEGCFDGYGEGVEDGRYVTTLKSIGPQSHIPKGCKGVSARPLPKSTKYVKKSTKYVKKSTKIVNDSEDV